MPPVEPLNFNTLNRESNLTVRPEQDGFSIPFLSEDNANQKYCLRVNAYLIELADWYLPTHQLQSVSYSSDQSKTNRGLRFFWADELGPRSSLLPVFVSPETGQQLAKLIQSYLIQEALAITKAKEDPNTARQAITIAHTRCRFVVRDNLTRIDLSPEIGSLIHHAWPLLSVCLCLVAFQLLGISGVLLNFWQTLSGAGLLAWLKWGALLLVGSLFCLILPGMVSSVLSAWCQTRLDLHSDHLLLQKANRQQTFLWQDIQGFRIVESQMGGAYGLPKIIFTDLYLLHQGQSHRIRSLTNKRHYLHELSWLKDILERAWHYQKKQAQKKQAQKKLA